jgi:hypothetical protein
MLESGGSVLIILLVVVVVLLHLYQGKSKVRKNSEVDSSDAVESDLLPGGSAVTSPATTTRRCVKCQAENRAGAAFCDICGAPLTSTDSSPGQIVGTRWAPAMMEQCEINVESYYKVSPSGCLLGPLANMFN